MGADDPFMLGPLGAMIALPSPVAEGFPAQYDRTAALHRSLNGGATVDVLGVHRVWEFECQYRHGGEADTLIARWTNPLAGVDLRLVDPLTPNRLSLDAASGGEVTGTVDAVARTGGTLTRETIADVPDDVLGLLRGGYRLAVADAETADVIADYGVGVPVLDDETITFRAWVRGVGSAALVYAYLLDDDTTGEVAGPAVTLGTEWTLAELEITPPAGTVNLALAVRIPAGVGDRHVDVVGLAAGPELDRWSPGGGAPVVLLEAFEHEYQRLGRRAMTLTVREV